MATDDKCQDLAARILGHPVIWISCLLINSISANSLTRERPRRLVTSLCIVENLIGYIGYIKRGLSLHQCMKLNGVCKNTVIKVKRIAGIK